MSQGIVDQFRLLEKTLADRFPQAKIEAEALAEIVVDPRTADADRIWPSIWNKPLFANTKVAIGENMVRRLEPFMKNAWRTWGGGEPEAFLIQKIGKGISTRSFEPRTAQAQDVRARTGIAMHRLFAIQGAAKALRSRASRNDAPYAALINVDPGTTVPMLQTEMGSGWGHITVLHFLTDLGLACKPDLHLMNTVRHLGMGGDLPSGKVPNLVQAIAVNRSVRVLLEKLDGATSPGRLRYMDKILMEISRCGLISAAQQNATARP